MNTFFVLQLYRQEKPREFFYCRTMEEYEEKHEEYPHYKLEKIKEGFYSSLDKAEEAMRASIERCGWTIYCCYIAEVPEETIVRDFLQDNYSLRVYDGEGVKIDERLFKSQAFSGIARGEYYGRRLEECRFKQGDVVEYIDWHREHGVLGVVDCIMLEHRDTPIGDDTDDGYLIWKVDKSADKITLDEYGEPNLWAERIRCTEVFSPHYPIPKTEQKRIENIREFLRMKYEL